ncbi:MAG TPA: acyltransferase family protein, partial [Lachnospiraceae bacterium]|nr:acyltransferase family protein [Lachnospiraceae bacterium]
MMEEMITDPKREVPKEGVAVTKKIRQEGPDIVRTIAAVFVVAVHFYLNCGYYSEPLDNPILFIMTVARWLFLICVPLFMILTGYFKSEKTLSKSHYMGIVPIMVSYVVISIIKAFACNYVYGTVYTFKYTVKNIANYQLAWYTGMYLSLMVLIPFLNRLWKALVS